jgi:DNA-binding transcriptional ArsR family regulator
VKLETAARQLGALGNPTRLRIYRTLVRAGRGGMAVGQVQEQVRLPASTLSHHLKRLIDQKLVRQDRAGTSLICHAEYAAMNGLLGFLADECCADEGSGPAPKAEAIID